ncbi:MAG: tetratricopeptide repeat protein [Spirochaetaceae bacterium]|nr:tetratricopeptide repeat protein [Spirochaetaceae bacterium]
MENSLKNAKFNTFFKKLRIPVLVTLGVAIVIALVSAVAISVGESKVKKVFESLDAITKNVDKLRDLENAEEKKTKEDEVISSLEKFIEENKNYPGAILRANMAKADIHFDKGEFEKARDAYIAAAETFSDVYISGIAYYNAAVACEELNDLENSAKYFKLSYEQKDFALVSHAMFNAGRILDTLKKYDEAAAIFKELTEKFPEDPWADLAKSRLLAMEVAGLIEETVTDSE